MEHCLTTISCADFVELASSDSVVHVTWTWRAVLHVCICLDSCYQAHQLSPPCMLAASFALIDLVSLLLASL